MHRRILLLTLISTAFSARLATPTTSPGNTAPQELTTATNHLKGCLKDIKQASANLQQALHQLNYFKPKQAETLAKKVLVELSQAGTDCTNITKIEVIQFFITHTSKSFELCLADIVLALKGVQLVAQDVLQRDWQNLIKDLRGQADLVQYAVKDCRDIVIFV